jgi:tRNA(Leu) C34 or U34 (ribose-2'-O)-methylase TrmL
MDGPHQEEEEKKKDDTKIMSLSSHSVELAMQYNPDACYPSIRIVDCHRTGMESFDKMDAATTLVLEVRTRMCTVLHSPLVFKFLHSLSSWPTNLRLSSASDTSIHLSKPIVCRDDDDTKAGSSPIVVSCIEKVANLHRLLMLCHNFDINLLSNIVVVLPNSVTDGRRKDEIRLREFEDAVDNFYKFVVVNSDRGNVKCHLRPIIVHEDTAFKIISDMMSERSHTMTTSSAIVSCSRLQSIVGIDLHPSALTLEGNNMTTTTSPALHKLKNADAIVFGYESTGIPDVLTKPLNDWVQIPSRSSINVVAAMSIIFDALFA